MGIKETKEVVTLAKVVTVLILQEAQKNGFQWGDLGAFLKSDEFAQTAIKAAEGIEKVGKELVDLDFIETIELSRHVYLASMEIIDQLKKSA